MALKTIKAFYSEDPFSAIVLTAAVIVGIVYLIRYLTKDKEPVVVDPVVPERLPNYQATPNMTFSPSMGNSTSGMGSVGGVGTGFSGGGARVGAGGVGKGA